MNTKRVIVLLVVCLVTRVVRAQEEPPRQSGEERTARTALIAGDLRIVVEDVGDGVRLASLSDTAAEQELLAASPLPLFTLTLRHVDNKEQVRLTAEAGWGRVQVVAPDPAKEVLIHWEDPKDKQFGDVRVEARAKPNARANDVTICGVIDSPTTPRTPDTPTLRNSFTMPSPAVPRDVPLSSRPFRSTRTRK